MDSYIPAFLIGYSDSSFTNPHETVLPDEPADCRGMFTHMGVKYWGFETDRHRSTTTDAAQRRFLYDHDAHHWIHIGFHERAVVNQISISTKWFTGNQVREVSVILMDELNGNEIEVLTRQPLNPDSEHVFEVPGVMASEALVHCYYEGGISRINFFGVQTEEQMPERQNMLVNATISNISNSHYGSPAMAVNGQRKETHMVGWESARTGFGEQAVFHLADPVRVEEIVVDTYMHRLNPPLSSHVFGLDLQPGTTLDQAMKKAPRWKLVFDGDFEVIPENFQSYMLGQEYLKETGIRNCRKFAIELHQPDPDLWRAVLPFAPLAADTFHRFRDIVDGGPFTHILYMHYPNGGIHGLKLYGEVVL